MSWTSDASFPAGREAATGARGPSSGQEFYEDHLLPRYSQARRLGVKLNVRLDGVEFGYPIGFLDEAFGQLSRKHGADAVLQVLHLHYPTDVDRTIETVETLIQGQTP